MTPDCCDSCTEWPAGIRDTDTGCAPDAVVELRRCSAVEMGWSVAEMDWSVVEMGGLEVEVVVVMRQQAM